MEVVNLLQFLNSVQNLYALSYAKFSGMDGVDLLDFMTLDEQLTPSIDFGLIYIKEKTLEQYTIVDGISRILALCLLLHAICECYKKTSQKNDKAIKTIRSKYLFSGRTKLKLVLSPDDAELYSKIINGERLSGHEKSKPMFMMLHKFWSRIKEENLHAHDIFKILQKINITVVEIDNVHPRKIYYTLNKRRKLNQLLLIEDYLKENKMLDAWQNIKSEYCVQKNDIIKFLSDFMITKYRYKSYNPELLYENFVNYCETIKSYVSPEIIIKNLRKSAKLYYNMLNVEFNDDNIKHAFINIKKHDGEDTYAYILSVYEDYYSGNISDSTFIEILNTIDEYLINRQNSGKNIDFNELVHYLNAFITFK